MFRINKSFKSILWLWLLLYGVTPLYVDSSTSGLPNTHIAVLAINGPIGPATKDYFERSLKKATEQGASAVILKLDTPGGLDSTTRDIVKTILAAPIPIITYVYPAGSRAASAGTYILYGSHIAAMSPSTTLGAATPVNLGTPSWPKPTNNEKKEKPAKQETVGTPDTPKTAIERKLVNDAVAYIQGLAIRHGRNADWAEQAVREAATLTANDALNQQVIDIVADNINDLVRQIDNLKVVMESGQEQVINSDGISLINYNPDWRTELLAIITNPQIAYIMLMIGIYGLILEGYNPGALVPGVIGGICLLTALYALQVLPVNYAGLALIILGMLLIVAESIAPSFGILGIGGVIALTLGSIMLIDSDVPGMDISIGIIGGFAAISGVIVLVILIAVGRSLRMKRVPVEQALVNQTGVVESFEQGKGLIRINGERWSAISEHSLNPGQTVTIVAEQGLILDIEPTGEHE